MKTYTCKDAVDVLLDYLDGDMDESLRTKLEAHLHGCTPCEEFLASYKSTTRLCKEALAEQMPCNLKERLKGFLRANLKKE